MSPLIVPILKPREWTCGAGRQLVAETPRARTLGWASSLWECGLLGSLLASWFQPWLLLCVSILSLVYEDVYLLSKAACTFIFFFFFPV